MHVGGDYFYFGFGNNHGGGMKEEGNKTKKEKGKDILYSWSLTY